MTVPICNDPKAYNSDGEIYHCYQLDCPIHGERNKAMINKSASPVIGQLASEMLRPVAARERKEKKDGDQS